MRSLIILLILLSVMFQFSSCSSFPVMPIEEVCAMNVTGKYCRCGLFDFNLGKLQSVSESKNMPLEYCHKNIGLSAAGWINIIIYLDEIYTWKKKKFTSKKMKRIRKHAPEKRDVPDNETMLGLLSE